MVRSLYIIGASAGAKSPRHHETMKTYSDTITNTIKIELDDITFTVGNAIVSGSVEVNAVYDYHPEEQGDWDTPTKAAYAELVKINPPLDCIELVIESPDLPAPVEVSSYLDENGRDRKRKDGQPTVHAKWCKYIFKHAENILIEKTVEELTRKFEYGGLPENHID